MTKPTQTDSEKKTVSKTAKDGAPAKWDDTDESAAESFPASDAPTSWAGRDIAPQDRAKGKDDS